MVGEPGSDFTVNLPAVIDRLNSNHSKITKATMSTESLESRHGKFILDVEACKITDEDGNVYRDKDNLQELHLSVEGSEFGYPEERQSLTHRIRAVILARAQDPDISEAVAEAFELQKMDNLLFHFEIPEIPENPAKREGQVGQESEVPASLEQRLKEREAEEDEEDEGLKPIVLFCHEIDGVWALFHEGQHLASHESFVPAAYQAKQEAHERAMAKHLER